MEEYPIYHYYHPQTKFREGNVFTPVRDSVHGGGSLSGGLCPGGVCVQGVSIQEGSLSKGGGLCPGGFLSGRPPSPYSKEQALRILLECILVQNCSHRTGLKHHDVKPITRQGDNFMHVVSLCIGTKFLVVIIETGPVHSEFDIKLC